MQLESKDAKTMKCEPIAVGTYTLDVYADGMIRLHVMPGIVAVGGVAMTAEEARNIVKSLPELIKTAEKAAVRRNSAGATR